jgi:hypothetical protein
MMSTIRNAWVMAVVTMAAVLLPSLSLAQVTVSARLTPSRVYVGDSAQLEIEVGGSKSPERPRVPDVPGLSIGFAGGQDASRHSIMIINGRRTEESFEGYVFAFRVTPTQAGRFTIPAITVTVDGKDYTTDPVSLSAAEPGEIEGFKLVLEAEKTDVYVGEPVKVRMTWYITQDVNPQRLTVPESGEYDLLPAPAPDVRGRQIKLFNQPAVQGRGTLDGVDCVTATTDRIFVAKHAGQVTLGPARIVMDLGDAFFGPPERHVISSNPLVFNVKPLPLPQPANFNGLIGEYTIESQASATDVHVGDPITLTVTVKGPEPLEAVPAMDFSTQPGFAGAFRLSGEPSIPSIGATGDGRAAVFTTTIRAENEDVTEIPPVELAYFDVGTGKYGVAKSKAIPIKVKPTTEVGLPADLSDHSSRAAAKEESVGGLAPIVRSPEVLTEGRFDLVTSLRSPLVIGVSGAPALLYLGSVGVVALRRRSERDPARRRRRGAPGRALRRLSRAGRKGGGPTEIGAALRGFVADWFDVPEAGFTSAEAVARLQEAGAGSAAKYAEVLERCDSALYGHSGAAASVEEAQGLVRDVTRDLETTP